MLLLAAHSAVGAAGALRLDLSSARPARRGAAATSAAARRRLLPVAAAAAPAAAPAAKPSLALALPRLGGGSSAARLAAAERAVLGALAGARGRGKDGLDAAALAALEAGVAALEADGGVAAPTAARNERLLAGRWRLLFTSRPGTASPIQRAFTGVDAFSVYQDILADGPQLRVNNVVDFGAAIGLLKVEAEAATDARPLPGFTPRAGAGLPFGLLGTSVTTPPAKPDIRLDFAFDRAAFAFNLGGRVKFSVPYPVPFKLLGDERKGWIDSTYLSADGSFRVSRGNKGTLFLLQREGAPRAALLRAVTARAAPAALDAAAAAAAAAGGGERAPARSAAAAGTWRLVHARSGAWANPLQKALSGVVRNFQIISADGGRLENRVELLPGVRVRALAACAPASDTRTRVLIDATLLEVGPWTFNLPLRTDGEGYVDWLLLDEELRITAGNKGSTFVHVRD